MRTGYAIEYSMVLPPGAKRLWKLKFRSSLLVEQMERQLRRSCWGIIMSIVHLKIKTQGWFEAMTYIRWWLMTWVIGTIEPYRLLTRSMNRHSQIMRITFNQMGHDCLMDDERWKLKSRKIIDNGWHLDDQTQMIKTNARLRMEFKPLTDAVTMNFFLDPSFFKMYCNRTNCRGLGWPLSIDWASESNYISNMDQVIRWNAWKTHSTNND